MKILVFGKPLMESSIVSIQLVNLFNTDGTRTTSTKSPTYDCDTIFVATEVLQIFDLSGQETHKSFLPQHYGDTDIAIYCVDLSDAESDTQITDQIKAVQEKSPDVRILLVGTKCKQDASEQATSVQRLTALRDKLIAENVENIEEQVIVTSVKYNIGVDTLRGQLLAMVQPELARKLEPPVQQVRPPWSSYRNSSKPSSSLAFKLLCYASPVQIALVILAAGFGIGCATGAWESPATFGAALINHTASAVSVLAVSLFAGTVGGIIVANKSQENLSRSLGAGI